MSAPIILNVDLDRNRLVTGQRQTAPFEFSRMTFGNTLTFHIFLLSPSVATPFQAPTPYIVESIANRGVKMIVSNTLSTGANTVYGQKVGFTKSADNTHLIGDFDISSTDLRDALDALLPATTEFLTAKWEINVDEGGSLETAIQQNIQVFKRAFDPTVPSPPETESALSLAQGDARYIPNEGVAGGFRTAISPNGSVFVESMGDNGVMNYLKIN